LLKTENFARILIIFIGFLLAGPSREGSQLADILQFFLQISKFQTSNSVPDFVKIPFFLSPNQIFQFLM
jgi:hypothetical protein